MKAGTPPPSSKPPVPGRDPLLIWIYVIGAALFVWMCFFVASHSGRFNSRVIEPWKSPEQLAKAQPPALTSLIDKGRGLYASFCSQCHQFDGMGDPQKAPSLKDAEWLMGTGPNRLGRIMLNGFTGPILIQGKTWNLNMPSWKNNMTDEQIAAVLNYTRNEWGNKASEFTPAQISKIRESTRTRSTPWTAEELRRIPEQ